MGKKKPIKKTTGQWGLFGWRIIARWFADQEDEDESSPSENAFSENDEVGQVFGKRWRSDITLSDLEPPWDD